jgi:pimeloyl-ACP methyl ester carboxylesterase
MTRSKPQPKPVSHPRHSAYPPTVSGRWLLTAIAIVIPGAAFSAWAVLCLLFWQGSWQLLYHPTSAVTLTPTTLGLAFNSVGFAPTDTGAPQLQGWWIPSSRSASRYTVLYLHGADGNLSDTLDDLGRLHNAGVNVLAFDYRGYGQSQFVHPSEAHMRQDAESALNYLTATRHVDSHSIVLDGKALGANLALEVAAAHPELAGVVIDSPLDNPAGAIFSDPRSRLVPAHLLVSDRFDTAAPAAALRIPSLWFFKDSTAAGSGSSESSAAFQKVEAPKTQIWLTSSANSTQDFMNAFSRWLDDLNK